MVLILIKRVKVLEGDLKAKATLDKSNQNWFWIPRKLKKPEK